MKRVTSLIEMRKKIKVRSDYAKQSHKDSYNDIISNSKQNSINNAIECLCKERQIIINNDSLKSKERLSLLENTEKTIIVLNGGVVRKTTSVINVILIFCGIITIVFVILNIFWGLSNEVLILFLSTATGGIIASITHNLEKLK